MSIATLTERRIASVTITDEAIVARLVDGRTVSVPLHWSWRLQEATPEQRKHWEIVGEGEGVRWPDVDEDISIEGMLRGVPARRPSRAETRVLLDASSLIDVEHGKPVSFAKLEIVLREQHARLILTYTSVLEFAAPFEKTRGRLALHDLLQQVDRLPTGYLREGAVKVTELREAVAAFNEGRECTPINPYGNRWDETLFADGPRPTEALVGQSLFDLVSMALSGGNVLRHGKDLLGPKLERGFAQVRRARQKAQVPAKERFQAEVRGELAHHSIPLAAGKLAEFASWIYEDPSRCPGLRLACEWHEEWRRNATQPFRWNNILDRAHVLAVPYVDAVTMDRNAADLCLRATKRLKAKNPTINYDERIFTGLEQLLQNKFQRDA
jgi:hypothetical protein